MKCIDQGDLVGTLFVDFRKAFDMVDHSLLIKKLSLYKVSNPVLKWFTSYLNTHLQAINSQHGLSDFCQTLSGVPQGIRTNIIFIIHFLSHIVPQISILTIVHSMFRAKLKMR